MSARGTDGFRFDKASLITSTSPIVILPGDSVTINAEFVAAKVGDNKGSVSTASDAREEVTSNWTGQGMTQGINATIGSSKVCVGDTGYFDLVITNTASADVDIIDIETTPSFAASLLDYDNPADKPPFKLSSTNPSKTIRLRYNPTIEGVTPYTITVKSSAQQNPDKTVTTTVEAVHYDAVTKVVLDNASGVYLIGSKFEEDQVVGSVNFELKDANISMAQLNKLDVEINYYAGFLKAEPSKIIVSSQIQNDFSFLSPPVITIDNTTMMGKIAFTLVANNGTTILNKNTELARFLLRTNLPTNSIDTSVIEAFVNATDNKCIKIANEHSKIKLQQICAYTIRKVNSLGYQFGLDQIMPNPVGSNGTDINFSVGFPVWTEIAIFNTKGELVSKPLSQIMKEGYYSIQLPVNDLTSGMYLVRMKSGPYEATEELVISK